MNLDVFDVAKKKIMLWLFAIENLHSNLNAFKFGLSDFSQGITAMERPRFLA